MAAWVTVEQLFAAVEPPHASEELNRKVPSTEADSDQTQPPPITTAPNMHAETQGRACQWHRDLRSQGSFDRCVCRVRRPPAIQDRSND